MTHAVKTGLPEYKRGDKSVYAAKITGMELFLAVQRQHPGATTLFFGEIDSKSNLIPKWMEEQKPEVGGYFVVEDGDDGNDFTVFVPESEFENNYQKVSA